MRDLDVVSHVAKVFQQIEGSTEVEQVQVNQVTTRLQHKQMAKETNDSEAVIKPLKGAVVEKTPVNRSHAGELSSSNKGVAIKR